MPFSRDSTIAKPPEIVVVKKILCSKADLRIEAESFVANGNEVKVIYAASPDEIDYTKYGISDAIIIDNTGVWRDSEGLGRHLKSKGASKVILTAPGKGDMKNVVAGI